MNTYFHIFISDNTYNVNCMDWFYLDSNIISTILTRLSPTESWWLHLHSSNYAIVSLWLHKNWIFGILLIVLILRIRGTFNFIFTNESFLVFFCLSLGPTSSSLSSFCYSSTMDMSSSDGGRSPSSFDSEFAITEDWFSMTTSDSYRKSLTILELMTVLFMF